MAAWSERVEENLEGLTLKHVTIVALYLITIIGAISAIITIDTINPLTDTIGTRVSSISQLNVAYSHC